MQKNLLDNLTFKTISYGRNRDNFTKNEKYITEHEGVITEIKFEERKPPVIAGEYGFTIFNIGFAKQCGCNLIPIIEEYSNMDSYSELLSLIENNHMNINNINKLILIHRFILHANYRKMNIFNEYIKYMNRDFFWGNENMMLILVKPIQSNHIDWDLFKRDKNIKVKHQLGENSTYDLVPSYEYYGFDDLIKNKDMEMMEYKLFSIASKCEFNRISNSYLFEFKPEKN